MLAIVIAFLVLLEILNLAAAHLVKIIVLCRWAMF